MQHWVPNQSVFLDAGSNIGIFAIQMSAKHHARVLAIDALSTNCALLLGTLTVDVHISGNTESTPPTPPSNHSNVPLASLVEVFNIAVGEESSNGDTVCAMAPPGNPSDGMDAFSLVHVLSVSVDSQTLVLLYHTCYMLFLSTKPFPLLPQ